jgi:hypothetical protein
MLVSSLSCDCTKLLTFSIVLRATRTSEYRFGIGFFQCSALLDPIFALYCRNSGAPETKARGQPRESDADKETETNPALTLAAIDH